MDCFTYRLLTLGIGTFILVHVAICQETFKLDREKNKYWNGIEWSDLGDDTYERMISSYEPALNELKSGKTLKTWADIVGGVSGFSIGWGLGTDLSKKSDQVNKPSTTAFYVVGGILMIPAIILEINGNNAIKRSAYIYDDHLKGSPDDSALQQIRFSPLYDARRQEFGFQINFELH